MLNFLSPSIFVDTHPELWWDADRKGQGNYISLPGSTRMAGGNIYILVMDSLLTAGSAHLFSASPTFSISPPLKRISLLLQLRSSRLEDMQPEQHLEHTDIFLSTKPFSLLVHMFCCLLMQKMKK